MKKMRIAFLAAWLVMPLAAQAQDPIGSVVAVQGQATAKGADGQVRALEIKGPVFQNDEVVTAAKSKLQIQFEDDTIVSLGEQTAMTIDEYVYSPQKKDENACSVGFAKGIFRTITGKITKLNPDRFKVRTKMATIGIRGTDVGGELKPDGEDIYVIDVHEI
jgi:hypothetical protein